jgi:hypothetical protein
MILALGVTAVMTQIVSRLSLKERAGLLLRSLDWKSGLLIVSVMVFKKILEVSGAPESVSQAIPPQRAGAYVLLFAAPFIMFFESIIPFLADSSIMFLQVPRHPEGTGREADEGEANSWVMIKETTGAILPSRK